MKRIHIRYFRFGLSFASMLLTALNTAVRAASLEINHPDVVVASVALSDGEILSVLAPGTTDVMLSIGGTAPPGPWHMMLRYSGHYRTVSCNFENHWIELGRVGAVPPTRGRHFSLLGAKMAGAHVMLDFTFDLPPEKPIPIYHQQSDGSWRQIAALSRAGLHVSSPELPPSQKQNLSRATALSISAPTVFDPVDDFWHFGNEGSFYTPAGFGTGQALSALWYFQEARHGTGPLSAHANRDNTRIWEDDWSAIEIVVLAQKAFRAEIWKERVFGTLDATSQETGFAQIKTALGTGSIPVLLAFYSSTTDVTTFMIAHQVSGNRITIIDPSRPDRQGWITFDPDAKRFMPYSTTRCLGSPAITYDWIRPVAPEAIPGWHQMEDICDFEPGFVVRLDSDLDVFIDDPLHGRQVLLYRSDDSLPLSSTATISTDTPCIQAIMKSGDLRPPLLVRVWDNGKWYAATPGDSLPAFTVKPDARGVYTACIMARMEDGALRWVDIRQVPIAHAPVILSIKPRAAWEGKKTWIRGKAFGKEPGKVMIGAHEAGFVFASAQKPQWKTDCVLVYIPDGIPPGMHDIVVIDAKGYRSNAFPIRVLPSGWTPRDAPIVKGVQPSYGATAIVDGQFWSRPYLIYGDGFNAASNRISVTIGGISVPIDEVGKDLIRFHLTPECSSGDLIVEANYIESEPISFPVLRPIDAYPNISSITVRMTMPLMLKAVTKSNLNDQHAEFVSDRLFAETVEINKRLDALTWNGGSFVQTDQTPVVIGDKTLTRTITYAGTLSDDGSVLRRFRYHSEIYHRSEPNQALYTNAVRQLVEETCVISLRDIDCATIGVTAGDPNDVSTSSVEFVIRAGDEVRGMTRVHYKRNDESEMSDGTYYKVGTDFKEWDTSQPSGFSLEAK